MDGGAKGRHVLFQPLGGPAVVSIKRVFGSSAAGVTCALAGFAIAMSSQVSAQDAAPAGEELEVVVVSGIRASRRESLSEKRESMQVVDAISAEDVGDFPDKNIGEALQRVTELEPQRLGESCQAEARMHEGRLVDPRAGRV